MLSETHLEPLESNDVFGPSLSHNTCNEKHCITFADFRDLHPAGGLVLQDAPAPDAAGLLLRHLGLARGHGRLLLPEGARQGGVQRRHYCGCREATQL